MEWVGPTRTSPGRFSGRRAGAAKPSASAPVSELRQALCQTGRTRDFYIRQLRDWKFSIEIQLLRPEGLQLYGALCGWTLARAHARSGDRIAIAAYLGGSDVFDRAIAKFAAAYADQNERDYQALVDTAKSGRITAEHGL